MVCDVDKDKGEVDGQVSVFSWMPCEAVEKNGAITLGQDL
jgi:hypothetical protein